MYDLLLLHVNSFDKILLLKRRKPFAVALIFKDLLKVVMFYPEEWIRDGQSLILSFILAITVSVQPISEG